MAHPPADSSLGRPRAPALWPSLLAGFAAASLLLALLQRQPHSDGITYLYYLEKGERLGHHLLYLPLLAAFTTLCEALGLTLRTAAFAFSAACVAGSVLLLDRLVRSSHVLCPHARWPSLWTALLALSPAALFFGTTVENHAHHLFWCAAFLFGLDRVLGTAPARFGRLRYWPIATLLLLAVYTSHSSSLLLWPGILLWLHLLQGSWLRWPDRGALARYLLLFGPVLGFKFAEPQIKAYWLGGGEEQLSDAHLRFALDLLGWRDPITLLRYLGHEVLLPIGALLLAGAFVLRGRALVTGLALLLPYVLFFGHWNVYEFGAYYLAPAAALLPVLAARDMRLGRGAAASVLCVALGLAVYGVVNVTTYVERQPLAAWNWASDLRALTTPSSTVIVYSGFRGVTVIVETDIEDVVMLENLWIHFRPQLERQGQAAFEHWTTQTLPGLFAAWTAPGKGPLFVGDEAHAALARDWPPVLRWLEAHAEFRPAEHGIVRGYVLTPR